MTETFRNHPSVMIKNLFVAVVLIAIMLADPEARREKLIMYAILIAVAVYVFLVVRWWAKTTVTFTDVDMVMVKDTIYKNKKTVPYSKVASVNVVRGVFDRLFGTTTLSFNVNSGVNAATPEIVLTLKIDDAERMRSFVSSLMFDREYVPEVENQYESVVTFKAYEVLMHSIFSLPTLSTLMSLVFLGYSIWSLIFIPANGGALVAIMLFAVTEIVPVVRLILVYLNFKVYRVNDTIHLQHGAIQTFRSSFDVSKINAIRVKKPFIARMMHMSCLEAEVVGINAVSNNVRPVLCLLIKDDRLESVMKQLVPEMMYDCKIEPQPKETMYPEIFKAFIMSVIIVAIAAYPSYYLFTNASSLLVNAENIAVMAVKYIVPVIALVIVFAVWTYAHIATRCKGYNLDEDLFTFVIGVVDREVLTMQYDRVQIVELSSGPMARKYGLSKCTVSLLSAAGQTNVKSGYFRTEDLRRIGSTIMDRLSNGKYDYTKCVI